MVDVHEAPSRLSDPDAVPAELKAGQWIILRHEHFASPARWISQARYACERAGIRVEIVTDFNKDMTLIMNLDRMPTSAQIAQSVWRCRQQRALELALAAETHRQPSTTAHT